MKRTMDEVLHVRVEPNVHDAIKKRARREQRTVADMARLLLAYALTEMPLYTAPRVDDVVEETG